MKVFVTGAPGFIGTAVTKELVSTGHTVLGLTRSDKGADHLKSLGAQVHRGNTTDLEDLKKAASQCDAVIHLAFDHDFSRFEQSCRENSAAIDAIGEALAGTNKPFAMASGTLLTPSGVLTDEDASFEVEGMGNLRALCEKHAIALAKKGVRSSVVRLAPTNHGKGDGGFISILVVLAKKNGISVYLGDGLNHWPAVHVLDSARLFVLAIEKAKAGSILHATAEQAVPIKVIAEAIGKRFNVPTVSKPREEGQAYFQFLAWPLSFDNMVSSEKTREKLGWKPVQPTLVEDIASGGYDDATSKFFRG